MRIMTAVVAMLLMICSGAFVSGLVLQQAVLKCLLASCTPSQKVPLRVASNNYAYAAFYCNFSVFGMMIHHERTDRVESRLNMGKHWISPPDRTENDIFRGDGEQQNLEFLAVRYVSAIIRAQLIRKKMESSKPLSDNCEDNFDQFMDKTIRSLVRGRFVDMSCTIRGENGLEHLFAGPRPVEILKNLEKTDESEVIIASIMVLQSLLVLGMQLGLKGSTAAQQGAVAHLTRFANGKIKNDALLARTGLRGDNVDWATLRENNCRLKFERDTKAGTLILASLKMKRTSQGAFKLFVSLGIWDKHEDVALLRSGFPTRFTEDEELAAKDAKHRFPDSDSMLGIRKDLRQLKVYTIDGESTSEIDDGLSIEAFTGADGSLRKRFWIHIADADRWAPVNTLLRQVAQKRATSLYLATGTLPMFPNSVAHGCMSLRAGSDSYALSLGVELLFDGSLDKTSIVLLPTLIRVTYRLTYEDADEMLEEGVGYNEEWQLGALLSAAKRRRNHRCQRGALEGIITEQIPQSSVSVQSASRCSDGDFISIKVSAANNSGMNVTARATSSNKRNVHHEYAPMLSPSSLLVTEMMILAGEAMGKWAVDAASQINGDDIDIFENLLFRSQEAPDLRDRLMEANYFKQLKDNNVGGGYCAAWYFRRFIRPVKVSRDALPHSGLGLDYYIQWTSPIRRFSDLQIHSTVKQIIRGKKQIFEDSTEIAADEAKNYDLIHGDQKVQGVKSNDCSLGFMMAARPLMRTSNLYWILEHVRRRIRDSAGQLSFQCLVLGCVNEERKLYSLYLFELGLERRYLSEKGELNPGNIIWLKVADVKPRIGLLTLSLTNRSSGITAAAA